MQRSISFVVLLLLAVTAYGCSSKPDASYVEKEVKAAFASVNLDKVTEIKNFKKVNGFEKDSNTYVVDVTYDILLKVSARNFFAKLKELGAENKMVREMLPMNMVSEQVTSAIFGSNFKEGDERTITQQLTFIKTDNGWIVPDFQNVDKLFSTITKATITPVKK